MRPLLSPLLAPALAILLCTPAAVAREGVSPRPSHGKGGKTGLFTSERITAENRARNYRLVVPGSVAEDEPVPLVFAFHGFLIDNKDVMPLYTRLDDLAKEEGFILVYPNALDARWRLGFVDRAELDLAFFDALLDEITRRYNIDLNRVYATGMSNGAYFVNLLGSKRSDRIAAIAPHSGGLGRLALRGVKAERKYPVLVIHGAVDNLVPVDQGRQTREVYEREGHEVEYVEVPDLGHMWAGKAGINRRMWDFFAAHPLVPE